MERVIDVAQYLFIEYKRIAGYRIDEMKLHKLLYLAQRESLAITDTPLFAEEFEGWKYGPVCRTIRNNYTEDGMYAEDIREIAPESKYIVNNIIRQYGAFSSWKLSEISHRETAWRNTRKGLRPTENGSRVLQLEDIREDAKKVRPYDSLFDMFYDEFEDAEVG